MSLALHALLCRLRAVSWIEYVASQSNAADGGTRAGMADVVVRELRVPLRQVPFPAWMASLFYCSPVEVLRLVEDRLAQDGFRWELCCRP